MESVKELLAEQQVAHARRGTVLGIPHVHDGRIPGLQKTHGHLVEIP